jgi:glycosyltransferase involved in cell wall biosynthesis
MSMVDVSAIIPCLNEEKTIGICIEKFKRAVERLGLEGEIIVSDNGSTDRSVEIAEKLGARVVHTKKRGYGAALINGFSHARGQILIMADADDSYDWENIEPFIDKINEGYDLVMGNRFKGGIEPGAMPFLHKYLGNPVLSLLARISFKIPVGDFHCGMRAISNKAIKKLSLTSSGMEFATEMIANAAREGLKITEIPIKLYHDKRDRPPHLRSFRDGWRHLRFIMTNAPDYLYFIPGLLLLFSGVIGSAALFSGPIIIFGQYIGIHFLALSCLLTIIGYNILWLGVMAKAIISTKFPNLRSRLLDYTKRKRFLESCILVALILMILGLSVDTYIFMEWLDTNNEMNETVHSAFVATTLIALGIMTFFYAFLYSLHKDLATNEA